MRSLLGLVNWIKGHLPGTDVISILSRLTDKLKVGNDCDIQANDKDLEEFEILQEKCMNPSIIVHLDWSKEFFLHTDTSEDGITSILRQEHGIISHAHQVHPISEEIEYF